MQRPSPSLGSAAGQSLVGTLIGAGLLLAMITTGLTLVAATDARHVPAAQFHVETPVSRPCPAAVLDDARAPSKRACLTLVVHNDGDADGTAICTIGDAPPATVFQANGIHVFSTELEAGAAEPLLIRVDGAGRHPSVAGTCTLPTPAHP
jgi:hypothetical protein